MMLPLFKVAVYRYVSNDIHGCSQYSGNYYTLFTKSILFQCAHYSLTVLRLVFYIGIQRAT